MRNTAIAIVFSLLLSSCASNTSGTYRSNDFSSDAGGALIIAAILGGAVAIAAH